MRFAITFFMALVCGVASAQNPYFQEPNLTTGLDLYAVAITDGNKIVSLTEDATGNNPGLYFLMDADVAALDPALSSATHSWVIRDDEDDDGYDATDPVLGTLPGYVWDGSTSYLAVLANMTQPVPTTVTGNTVGGSLNAARAQGFGRWVIDAGDNTMTLYAPDDVTPIHVFTLAPSWNAARSRTPE